MADGKSGRSARKAPVGDQRAGFAQAFRFDVARWIKHFLHAGAAARAFIADQGDIAGCDLAIENAVDRCILAFENARRAIETQNALIDTGAKMLSLPQSTVEELGLVFQRKRSGRTPAGTKEFDIYSPVRLTIQGRDCVCEVAAIPDDCPPLIGQLPLEMLDFYVDPAGQRLIGNPEHGGEHMIDMF